MLRLHTNTILNPNPHSPETFRESLIIGYVHARLYGYTHALLQRHFPAHPRGVVDIESDVVAEVVREEDLHGVAGHIEVELGELVFQTCFGDFVQFIQRCGGGGAAEGDARALGGKHSIVKVTLGCSEARGGREGAGDVSDVIAVLAAGVDEDDVIGVQEVIVADVVDHAGVLAAGDDGDVGGGFAAVNAEVIVQEGCEVFFVCPCVFHGSCENSGGDLACFAHVGDFGGALEDAEIVDEGF